MARLSRVTDPVVIGERIRNARLAAGLTQEELAEGAASAAYISRIEAGNRRPGTRLLSHIAHRLSTPVESLVAGDDSRDRRLELDLSLDYAELALKSGDPAVALEGVREVLARTGEEYVGDSAVIRARSIKAAALEVQGNYERAIPEFEWLVAQSPRGLPWIELVMALSRCYRESGQFAQAVEVGDAAMEEIERLGLAGTKEAIRLTLTVASAHINRGDLSHALQICERAADEAEQLGSDLARASAYWNASIVQNLRGHAVSAVELAKQALTIFEADADARSRAILRGVLAEFQLRLVPPDLDSAESNILKALDVSSWSDASSASRARLYLTSAKVLVRRSQFDAAREIAIQTLESMEQVAPLVAADALILLGRIEVSHGSHDPAIEHFHRAALLLSASGADRYVAECWFELGALLEEVGEESGAMNAYRRAAASTGLPIPAISAWPIRSGLLDAT